LPPKLISPVVAPAVSLMLTLAVAGGTAHAGDTAEAKKIFNQRCTACHSFGKGVKVGPDLKGVNQRRQRPWLLKFIRSSQGLIKAGDPVAQELFAQFKQQRMPDWTDLSEKQVSTILDWLAQNGPEQKEPDERSAELATVADINRAREIFHGRTKLAHGGLACSSCHSIRESGQSSGGTLAPELTSAYLRYRDRAMTLFLKKPCSQRTPEIATGHYLTPHESFAIKAYLRHAAVTEQKTTPGRVGEGELAAPEPTSAGAFPSPPKVPNTKDRVGEGELASPKPVTGGSANPPRVPNTKEGTP
jgi:cytochrome c2